MKGKKHVPHAGAAVRTGPYTIYAAGAQHLTYDIVDEYEILVPLTDMFQDLPAEDHEVIECYLPDFGGVPEDWRAILADRIIPRLMMCETSGKRMLTYCFAGHGRTGTMLASLIALLESEEETPDPIAAVRERHCSHAVETLAQAEGVFALRGQPVPEKYLEGPEKFTR